MSVHKPGQRAAVKDSRAATDRGRMRAAFHHTPSDRPGYRSRSRSRARVGTDGARFLIDSERASPREICMDSAPVVAGPPPTRRDAASREALVGRRYAPDGRIVLFG